MNRFAPLTRCLAPAARLIPHCRRRNSFSWVFYFVLCQFPAAWAQQKEEPSSPSDKPASLESGPDTAGYRILVKYCQQCHGVEFYHPGLNFRDRQSLIEPDENTGEAFLVVGDGANSRILEQMLSGAMPPEDQAQPTDEEIESVRKWIDDGAVFPTSDRGQRNFIGEQAVLQLIRDDLNKLDPVKRTRTRYFSLAHLWNDRELDDEYLSLVRAALSKLLNSLSSHPRITRPTIVDDQQLLLRIDLADYGWSNRVHWQSLLKAYPYGIEVDSQIAAESYNLTSSDLPYLRADWFVHYASRPPLYHELVTFPKAGEQLVVGIPEKLSTLERRLAVDAFANFQQNTLQRAAFTGQNSAVSDHNRMVERHDSHYGYFWTSYDSGGDSGPQNFFLSPLGPKSFTSATPSLSPAAFEHDGGEMIFSLPNHLQGYMLADAAGTRIEAGPQNIVKDPNRFSGSFDIVNGVSCMGCHKEGIIPFQDTLRQLFRDRSDDVAIKVQQIFPEQPILDEFIQKDRARFLRALEEAVGPFLRTPENAHQKLSDFPEPITAVSKRYGYSLTLDRVASELGLPPTDEDAKAVAMRVSSESFGESIQANKTLQKLELAPLAVGETITRQQWESVYQSTALELEIGTPHHVR